MIEINTDVPLNKNGTNANIKFHILDESIMTRNRFRHIEDRWVFSCHVPVMERLSLEIWYDLNEKELSIMVLDNRFGQPFDYLSYIINDISHKIEPPQDLVDIKEFVEDKVLSIQKAKIFTGYKKGDLI